MSGQLVVVGASVAATALIERIRELGNREPITVVDSDPDAPYDRPPVSKHYLVEADSSDIAVDWSDLDVSLVRAHATGVDPSAKLLLIEEAGMSRSIPFENLVIATGAIPARLPIEPPDTLVLRSADDARRLRMHTEGGRSVIIIGAGAIGVELASSLAARGCTATLVDRAAGPLERLLAGHLSAETTEWLESAGVRCVWKADIAAIEHAGDGWTVELRGEETLRADLLVSAVGARPAVAWLQGSGLLTDGALIADEAGRVVVEDQPRGEVFAIGDVVTRRHDDGSLQRTESWAAARQHATQLAEDLCGAQRGTAPKPYFWTEVAGRMVQVVGSLSPDDELVLETANPERRSALYRAAGAGEDEAFIGVNAQPRIARILMGA
ncbi:NAD(P)/FAD-dependent oxidoreductase [Leifsonia virtsii]|uniref:FAD-dependent oxidoreductase n=1 Tax=Leifsonia virtsii TaxID=3035915 RepID=A0ABT8IV81_9MICO|nr:FAD-dependent oxidoreductase [Leifsonia virtsii]MDN4596695.1 FAD-dependent oxidoreductase [Leifsonia virtsii]